MSQYASEPNQSKQGEQVSVLQDSVFTHWKQVKFTYYLLPQNKGVSQPEQKVSYASKGALYKEKAQGFRLYLRDWT